MCFISCTDPTWVLILSLLSSSLLIQVPLIEVGCSVLKQQHPASNPHLFNLWILKTIYSKNAHQYVFLIRYGSKRRHPGVIQCSTPERASEAEKVHTHTRTHKQPPPFPPFKAAAQGPSKEPLKGLIARHPITSIQLQSSLHTRKLTTDSYEIKTMFFSLDLNLFFLHM